MEFENGPEIAFDPVEETHAGYYLLEVTDSEGPVARTAEVLLTVERRPPNDHFRNAFEIPPVADYTTNSFNKNGTVEAGEKAHAGVGPFHSIWWRYETNSLGGEATILGVATITATLDKGGVKSSPRLVIYTGDRVSALTQVATGAPRSGSRRRRTLSTTSSSTARMPPIRATSSSSSSSAPSTNAPSG